MCFKNRKAPALIVSGLSAVVVVLGVILLILAIVYETADTVLTADLGDLSEIVGFFRSVTFAVILVFALMAIVVGSGGVMCLLKPCRKSPCGFAACYGLSIFLVWIAFVIVGSVITGVVSVSNREIEKVCSGNTNE
jgi:hypothetical protein